MDKCNYFKAVRGEVGFCEIDTDVPLSYLPFIAFNKGAILINSNICKRCKFNTLKEAKKQ